MKLECPYKGELPEKHGDTPHIVNHGTVITVKKGEQQRFKCQECGHTFYCKLNAEVR